MPGKILIVDDEPAIREMVCLALRQADYACLQAGDAQEADKVLKQNLPDLLLLDWMLPGTSGLDLALRLRREPLTRHVPIILLTARAQEDDKLKGFDTGVDDYVTKPFSPRELIARVKALLRRAAPLADDACIEIEGLSLDPATHRVAAADQKVELGPTEFRLLHFFMAHPERVHSRERVLDSVWGNTVYIDERTIDVHIRRLRKALEPTGHDRLIQTVRGAGYRLSGRD
jgi:two-component system phosphate regulon response regulator PhoB